MSVRAKRGRTLVYRLEVKDDYGTWKGPYSASLWYDAKDKQMKILQKEMCGAHSDIQHPSPSNQFDQAEPYFNWHYGDNRLGCESPEQLKQWFGKYLEEFFKFDGRVRVAVYRMCKDAVQWKDGRQVVFDCSKAVIDHIVTPNTELAKKTFWA